MGGASRLRGGNQAKKAQLFKVSVFGSHAGPGSAKTDSFLCSSFLGPPPTSSFSGVVGTGIGLLSGYPETADHEMDGAFVGRLLPRCDPKCGQRVGAVSPGVSETADHEMDGGCPTRCDPKCGQRVGAVSPEAVMQAPMVPAACALSRCFENTGEYHVHELHDELFAGGVGKRSKASARLRRAGAFSSSLSRRSARCAEADSRPDSFESSFSCALTLS